MELMILLIANLVTFTIFLLNFAVGFNIELYTLMFLAIFFICKFFKKYIPKKIIIANIICILLKFAIISWLLTIGVLKLELVDFFGPLIDSTIIFLYFWINISFMVLLLAFNLIKFIIISILNLITK